MVQREPPPLLARLVLALFARPVVMRPLLAASRVFRATGLPRLLARLPGRVGFAFGMLASTTSPLPRRAYRSAGSGERGKVATLRGCVMEGLFAETNRATERTLVCNDYSLTDAPGQGCCGALHAHAGDLEGARSLARRNIAAFERSGADYIAVNASGCGAMMKEYGHLLADDPEWASRAAALSERDTRGGRTHEVTAASVSAARGTTPAALVRDLEGDLDAIVLRALEKRPEDRYPSAWHLVDDIRRHERGEPTIAAPN
jgi:glycolate oxidase iron-sulfur subunit